MPMSVPFTVPLALCVLWTLTLLWVAWRAGDARLADAEATAADDTTGRPQGLPMALMSSDADAPAPVRRRGRPKSAPIDKKEAYRRLFRAETMELALGWLQRLGVPVRDRWDVMQEVFSEAHRCWDAYDPGRSRPERWLNKIAVHLAAKYRDRARHRREVLAPEPGVPQFGEEPGADQQIETEEERQEVLAVVFAIDKELRSVLIAHDFDGIPMAEIAESLGIPVSTAYKWRARALAAVEEELRRRREAERERVEGEQPV